MCSVGSFWLLYSLLNFWIRMLMEILFEMMWCILISNRCCLFDIFMIWVWNSGVWLRLNGLINVVVVFCLVCVLRIVVCNVNGILLWMCCIGLFFLFCLKEVWSDLWCLISFWKVLFIFLGLSFFLSFNIVGIL